MIFFIFVSAVGTTGSGTLEAQSCEQLLQLWLHSDIFFTSIKYHNIGYNGFMKIAISACLCGKNVRYDGSNKKDERLLKLLKGHELVLICPETSAGFPIPHEPLEILSGKVFTSSMKDVTDKLIQGSYKCLAQIKDCDMVILKQKSPSCGKGKIYDGSFSGRLIEGNGIFTKMCIDNGYRVFSEEDYECIRKELG